MKSGFKDPIEPKVKQKSMTSPWDFTCPDYDQRTSIFTNAGSHYGVGFKSPVGHTGNPKMRADTLPYGRVNTMKVDQIPTKNLPIDMEK